MQKEEKQEVSDRFDFCNKVDIHALEMSAPLQSVVAICSEHSFRGIVVSLNQLDRLVSLINKPLVGCKDILPIVALDYPYGNCSIDVRSYMIMSAKEKGAKEVEIVAPYNLILEKDFKRIHEDASGLLTTAKKAGIGIKYVIDQSSKFLEDGIRTRLCRMISSFKMPMISTSLGFFDENIDHSDSIIKMRSIKSKIPSLVKSYIPTGTADELASYVKAGSDIIGLNWRNAAKIVHSYEYMINNV